MVSCAVLLLFQLFREWDTCVPRLHSHTLMLSFCSLLYISVSLALIYFFLFLAFLSSLNGFLLFLRFSNKFRLVFTWPKTIRNDFYSPTTHKQEKKESCERHTKSTLFRLSEHSTGHKVVRQSAGGAPKWNWQDPTMHWPIAYSPIVRNNGTWCGICVYLPSLCGTNLVGARTHQRRKARKAWKPFSKLFFFFVFLSSILSCFHRLV